MIQTTIDSPRGQRPGIRQRMNDERTSVAFRSAKARTFAERKATLEPPQIRRCPTTAQSFCVPKADIVAQGYDLSINRYKEVVHEEVEHRPQQAILDELESIEKEITQGMKQLRGMFESGK